jgi:hypothetical protein
VFAVSYERSLVNTFDDAVRLLSSIDKVEVMGGMSVLVLVPKTFNTRRVTTRRRKVKSPEVAMFVVVCSIVESNVSMRVEDCLTVEVS